MRYIQAYYDDCPDYDGGLAIFAQRHRTETCGMCEGKPAATLNGVALSRCALCKGAGTLRIAEIACDDCGQYHDAVAMSSWYVGPAETSRKDRVYAVLCGYCRDLTAHHEAAQEREEDRQHEIARRARLVARHGYVPPMFA
jgi:hypothetical protein